MVRSQLKSCDIVCDKTLPISSDIHCNVLICYFRSVLVASVAVSVFSTLIGSRRILHTNSLKLYLSILSTRGSGTTLKSTGFASLSTSIVKCVASPLPENHPVVLERVTNSTTQLVARVMLPGGSVIPSVCAGNANLLFCKNFLLLFFLNIWPQIYYEEKFVLFLIVREL